jgi:nucleotide-binding universal stress UspA family protein
MFQPQLILHPTDFSDCSRHAFDLAADLAAQYGARLLVLHVAETLGPENVTYGEAVSQLQPEGYRRRLWDDLREVRPDSSAGITVEHLLGEGDPATEIERIARERHCDLIVLGTHGRTGWKRLVMGSIAEHIIRHASCPVLTVKGP